LYISSSSELYERLLEHSENRELYWWPGYGTFEVLIGAILTQNANWNRVEISLENLRQNDLLELETLLTCKDELLIECIRPSGMFNNKSTYIKSIAAAIYEEFGDFEFFTCNVTRAWLLAQKGVGKETADSILCYACQHSVMVVDSYTHRLLSAFGYEFESYDDLQEWCMSEVAGDAKFFAHYHGLIVNYMKANSKGKKVNIAPLLQKEIR